MKWTEKQIEAWLVPETRTLSDTGGDPLELEQTKLFWMLFDDLIKESELTERELLEQGRKVREKNGYPFSIALMDGVAHLHALHCRR